MTAEQSILVAQQRTSPSARDRAVDISKGIGIFLVVLGHTLLGLNGALGQSVSRNAWITLIYAFHMALFFAISGGNSGRSAIESKKKFTSRVILNFLHPYFFWSVVLTGIGYLMRGYTNVSTDRFDLTKLFSILYEPPAVLWFLDFVLIAFVVLRLTFRWPSRVRLALAVLLTVSGYFLDVWLLSYLRYVGIFMLAAQFGLPGGRVISDRRLLCAAVLILAATAAVALTQAPKPLGAIPALHVVYLPAAFAGTFVVMWAARALDESSSSTIVASLGARALEVLGQRSMPIFLAHILFTAGTRIVMIRLGMDHVWVVGMAATLSGLLAPLCMAIVAEHFAVSRYLGWPLRYQSGVNSKDARQGDVQRS